MGNNGHRLKIISLVLVAVALVGSLLFFAEPALAQTPPPPPNANSEPVCKGGAMGWVLCPAADVLKSITEGVARFMDDLLVFEPLIGSEQGDALRSVWGILIGIANVALAIGFIVVIFSQATSVGLSSYGIKKLLPRIIVTAVLMNLSFYLCAIAVDAANIAGQSVKGVMQVGIDQVDQLNAAKGATTDDNWGAFLIVILTGLTIAGVTGALPFLLVVLASLAGALLTALAVLIIREVLIILLIVISGLAFAARVLPNTEKWFDMWRKSFTVMLVLYPIFMFVFYGSQFVAVTIEATAAPANTTDSWLKENMPHVVALLVMGLPLYAFPFILRSLGGVLDRFGVAINNRSRGLVDRTRNKAKEWSDNSAFQRGRQVRKQARDARKQNAWAGRMNPEENKSMYARFQRRASGGVAGLTGADLIANKASQLIAKSDTLLPEDSKRRAVAMGMTARGMQSDIREMQRRATELFLKNSAEARHRVASEADLAGMFGKGTYYEYDKQGNIIDKHTNTGLALSTMAAGGRVGVLAAGINPDTREKKDASGKVISVEGAKVFDGSGPDGGVTRLAMMEQIAKTGDGAAMGYALYGNKQWVDAKGRTVDASDPTRVRQVAKGQLADSQINDFMQFVGSNAGSSIGKIPHLFKADDALSGINGDQIADWHGTEYKAAASRIAQLRISGESARADDLENRIIQAWNQFQTDSHLQGKRNMKKAESFRDALRVMSGNAERVALREYGDASDTYTKVAPAGPTTPTYTSYAAPGTPKEVKWDTSFKPTGAP
jgi:hypothetical protein